METEPNLSGAGASGAAAAAGETAARSGATASKASGRKRNREVERMAGGRKKTTGGRGVSENRAVAERQIFAARASDLRRPGRARSVFPRAVQSLAIRRGRL